MSATGLQVFDKTVQSTNIWLDEIMDERGEDRQNAWHVLGAVLRAVRDRLPPGLAAHLGAQLPLLVRGTYYDQYEPESQPDVTRHKEEFLKRVERGFSPGLEIDPEDAVTAVFQVLSHHLDQGQAHKVWQALPEEVRALWPEPGAENQERPNAS